MSRTLGLVVDECPVFNFDVQGGPEKSRQSNFAVFTVEGGLDSKLPYSK